jgi:hypothetical protein
MAQTVQKNKNPKKILAVQERSGIKRGGAMAYVPAGSAVPMGNQVPVLAPIIAAHSLAPVQVHRFGFCAPGWRCGLVNTHTEGSVCARPRRVCQQAAGQQAAAYCEYLQDFPLRPHPVLPLRALRAL